MGVPPLPPSVTLVGPSVTLVGSKLSGPRPDVTTVLPGVSFTPSAAAVVVATAAGEAVGGGVKTHCQRARNQEARALGRHH